MTTHPITSRFLIAFVIFTFLLAPFQPNFMTFAKTAPENTLAPAKMFALQTLMGKFLKNDTIRTTLNSQGCTYASPQEYVSNPKCDPQHAKDVNRKKALLSALNHLKHEMYHGTSGRCGRDLVTGKSGSSGEFNCSGLQFGYQACFIDGKLATSEYCARQKNEKNPALAFQKQRIEKIRDRLEKVLSSPQTYSGTACNAKTLEEFTTKVSCSPSPHKNPHNFKAAQNTWHTLLVDAYHSSNKDYGMSAKGEVGQRGLLDKLNIIPNYEHHSESVLHQLLPGLTHVSVATLNSTLHCGTAGFPIYSCIASIPDKSFRESLLQLIKHTYPSNEHVDFDFLFDLTLNTLLIYPSHYATNNVLMRMNLKSATIKPMFTLKTTVAGLLTVVALSLCEKYEACDKRVETLNGTVMQQQKLAAITSLILTPLFCYKNVKCYADMSAALSAEFYILSQQHNACSNCPADPSHHAQNLAVSAFVSYGGTIILKDSLEALSHVLVKFGSASRWFKEIAHKIGGKYAVLLTGFIFTTLQSRSIIDDFHDYIEIVKKHPQCVKDMQCSIDALNKINVLLSNPILITLDNISDQLNAFLLSNQTKVTSSGNTLTLVPTSQDIYLLKSVFGGLKTDKKNICTYYRVSKNPLISRLCKTAP
jgi:hypothetical protein